MAMQFVIWIIGLPVVALAFAYAVILAFLLAARRRMRVSLLNRTCISGAQAGMIAGSIAASVVQRSKWPFSTATGDRPCKP